MVVIRTQISLTEDLIERARRVAAQRGISLAALIREALADALAKTPEELAIERAKRAVGGFRSGRVDTSEHHDDVLAEPGRW